MHLLYSRNGPLVNSHKGPPMNSCVYGTCIDGALIKVLLFVMFRIMTYVLILITVRSNNGIGTYSDNDTAMFRIMAFVLILITF